MRVTNNPAAFLRGRYDVVIEVMGGVEPARTLVARLLGRGIPVVTANQALMAAAGPELQALACWRGASLRHEASALAGIPFLRTLTARPLLATVEHFAAVLNGTANFVLSRLDQDGGTVDGAVTAAQRRGLTETDAGRDLDGDDAADKLLLLSSLFGWGRPRRDSLEVNTIRQVTVDDLRVARALGGALKPVAAAGIVPAGVEAFVGPAWVSATTPFATLHGTLNGIALQGRYVRDLFLSGPGAGPDVTAATLLDDVLETARPRPRARPRGAASGPLQTSAVAVRAPITPWFLRLEYPGTLPPAAFVGEIVTRAGLSVEHVTDIVGQSRYALVRSASRETVTTALEQLRHRHRLRSVAYRRIS